ncbi:MAG: KH domain-containing protein [Clostridia bacterium]|nr:KH domain-containing protein [Clostridia bacterium]
MKVSFQSSPTERAKEFAEGLLVKFGTPCTVKVTEDLKEKNIHMEISGDNLNAVIGRRGETLDALQYLTTVVANRGEDDHWRVMIDAQGYRSRREDSLESLAKKMAEKALKYKKPVALDPMPSHERRVIHSALQDVEGVSTYSTGNEPNRKVVILPEGATTKQPMQSGGKKNNYRRRRRPQNKKPQSDAGKQQ